MNEDCPFTEEQLAWLYSNLRLDVEIEYGWEDCRYVEFTLMLGDATLSSRSVKI